MGPEGHERAVEGLEGVLVETRGERAGEIRRVEEVDSRADDA